MDPRQRALELLAGLRDEAAPGTEWMRDLADEIESAVLALADRVDTAERELVLANETNLGLRAQLDVDFEQAEKRVAELLEENKLLAAQVARSWELERLADAACRGTAGDGTIQALRAALSGSSPGGEQS